MPNLSDRRAILLARCNGNKDSITNMEIFNYLTPQPEDLLSIEIVSDRIKLVTISTDFERDTFEEFTNEVTIYMFPSPEKDIQGIRDFIFESRQAIAAGYNLQFVILSKATSEFLGCVGLHGEKNARTPEIGIWLKKAAHGSGYGREAVHLVVNWTIENIDIDYFIYPVDRRNLPSRKIPESLGGRASSEFEQTTPTGKYLDMLVYRIDNSN
jgi:[ribosomal protein S5]-alanine N-acetyltransferase